MAYVYRDTPVGFHRLNKMPLDDREVFDNITDFLEYVESGTPYVGQRCVVRFANYEQPVIFKQGRQPRQTSNHVDNPIPVLELPTGYEHICKFYNNDHYVMVYYYNEGSVFNVLMDQVRFTDSFAWAMLPQASIIAGTDTDIDYLLEYYDDLAEDGPVEKFFTFRQPNFCHHELELPSNVAVNRISSISSNDAFFTTADPDISIMPKVRRLRGTITRLWVKANDYYTALGLGV